MIETLGMPMAFGFEFRDQNGVLIATRTCRNVICTNGKNLMGNVFWRQATQSAAWYVGLKGTGTPVAADTAASHSSWTEITAYSESARQALTLAAFSSGSSNNSASPAVFTINSASTIAGAFTIDNSTKGGTTGTLYNAADFSSPVTISSGTVTVDGIVLGS